MRSRDKAIVDDLARFRVMTRNHIVSLHFTNVKNPITATNSTLLRLFRQGLIERSANYQPYLYFPAEGSIKKDSAKILHFLAIADAYISLCKYTKPSQFVVEPKFSKLYAEPDAFTIFKGGPLFLEIQRSVYSEKVMGEKIARYEALFDSGIIKREVWQPSGRKVFPAVLILTKTRYAINSRNFSIIQVESVEEFMRMMAVPEPMMKPKKAGGVRIRIG